MELILTQPGLIFIVRKNLNRSTYELLKEYCKNGGRVLSFSRSIPFINGAESDEVEVLAKHYHKQWINTTNLDDSKVLKLLSRDNFLINDKTKNGMLYHQRRFMNDGQLLFIVNSHQNENAYVEVMLKGKYVTYMNLLTGKIYTYPSEVDQGNVRFSFNLESIGSALFAITNKKITELNYSPIVGVETEIKANGSIQVKREKDNVLKVNYLDIKTTNSELKDVYFMNATNYLYLENGIEMGNPWQHKIQYKQNHLALDTLFDEKSMFEVDYHFYIDENLKHLKRDSIRAVVERPGIGKIFVNGKMIEKIPGTWWIDKDFPVYNIGKFLHHGKNTITLKASRMHILTEVMPVYILGDFIVKPGDQGFKISGGDIKFPGSWRNAGLPFYPHSVIYSQIFNIKKTGDAKYMVQLGKWNGTLCEVLINDQSAGIISWQPYEMEVTDFLKNCSNKVAVRIFGSLKNTFGFFYHNNMNRHYWGPWAWNTGPEKIPTASEYFLMDYGLFEPFKMITIN